MDPIEAVFTGQLAKTLAGGVELGGSAKVGRLNIRIVEYAADTDDMFLTVNPKFDLCALFNTIDAVRALAYTDCPILRPGATFQSQRGEALGLIIRARGQSS